jgi:hypothetical protein
MCGTSTIIINITLYIQCPSDFLTIITYLPPVVLNRMRPDNAMAYPGRAQPQVNAFPNRLEGVAPLRTNNLCHCDARAEEDGTGRNEEDILQDGSQSKRFPETVMGRNEISAP